MKVRLFPMQCVGKSLEPKALSYTLRRKEPRVLGSLLRITYEGAQALSYVIRSKEPSTGSFIHIV